ncbi:hypothetical protein [Hyphomonas chukchiensis]|uniref:hypothetical protein n=1 Tax=Hyphomonas chukchiensis TaxID=1280947 RepID=UPI0030F9DA6A
MKTVSLVMSATTISELNIAEVVARICNLNSGLEAFWSKNDGWAPEEAAKLLGAVRLDWQTSLSQCLYLWITPKALSLSDGELILAWTNLGSLIEGSIKLLLSVYLKDYLGDFEGAKNSGSLTNTGVPKSPDILSLQQLKIYCQKKKLLGEDGDTLVQLVQERRNAVHAFKHTDLGDLDEYHASVRGYLRLLRSINNRLPYPDDIYVPREI